MFRETESDDGSGCAESARARKVRKDVLRNDADRLGGGEVRDGVGTDGGGERLARVCDGRLSQWCSSERRGIRVQPTVALRCSLEYDAGRAASDVWEKTTSELLVAKTAPEAVEERAMSLADRLRGGMEEDVRAGDPVV